MKKQNRLILDLNIIFVLSAVITEEMGLGIPLYYYNPNWSTVLSVPLIVVAGWAVLDNLAWLSYKKVGWIAGLVPLFIDFGLEYLAHHLSWWIWLVPQHQFTVFGAPLVNYLTYVFWGFFSIWLSKNLGKR